MIEHSIPLQNTQEYLKLLESEGQVIDKILEHELEAMNTFLKIQLKNTGLGYIGCDNVRQEYTVLKNVADSLVDGQNRPLIFKIDDFYCHDFNNSSLVNKTIEINNKNPKTKVILTGFYDSVIFNSKILDMIPSQSEYYSDKGKSSELQEFIVKNLSLFLSRFNGNLEILIHYTLKDSNLIKENVQLFIASVLIKNEYNRWQIFWNEGSDKGLTLFIVSNSEFNIAVNRLNFGLNYAPLDYQNRADCSLGAIDSISDSLNSHKASEGHGEYNPNFNFVDGGLSSDEYWVRIWPVFQRVKELKFS
jgi:hypothetical protein